jgi:hypothetical protein
MAIEKTVEIKVDSKQAEKNLKEINSTIDDQRAILVLLEEEYIKAKKALDDYTKSGKVNLAQEKQLKQAVSERKDALTDQRLGLKKLAVEQRAATTSVKDYRKEQKENTNIVRAIDKLTGGFATKIIKLTKGFKSSLKGIKGFVGGLSGVKKALIGTGIGALVVLVGTLVANFDKIKESLFGISKETKNTVKSAEKTASASQEQLDALNSSENILRAQGKSEKQIRDLKKQQTDETITALEAQLEAQKTVRQSQIDTAKRNKTILEGILNFITAPLKLLTKSIDSIGAKFGKDFGLTESIESFNEAVAGKLFSGIDEEGDEAIKETEKQLLKLKNARANFELQDKKDNENKAKEKRDKELKDAQELEDLKNRIREASANKEDERRALELQKIKEENQKLIDEAKAKGLLTEELQTSLNERLAAKQAEFDEIDRQRREEKNAKQLEETKLLNEQLATAETNLQQAKANAIQGGLQVIGTLAGKSKAVAKTLLVVEKGLAIAQVISNAARAIAQAKANLAATPAVIGLVPNPAYVIQAAATAKGILSTKLTAATSVATIAAQAIAGLGGGGGGGGASVGGLGGGASAETQPPQFNIVGATETSQLAEAVAGQTQEPVQAYVVANDVTTAQSLENNIVEGATL